MTHSLQTYASALRAMQSLWDVETAGGYLYVSILDGEALGQDKHVAWNFDGESPEMEAAVRSAVLKIAPGSYAFPRRKMGVDSAPIRVNLCNADGEHLEWSLGKSSLAGHGGATYAEAWLNAAVALVEAGMVSA